MQEEQKKVSKAQQRATNRYISKAYDRVNLTVPKGHGAKIKAHAEARGESTNGFIKRAISEAMERDTTGLVPVPAAPIGDTLASETLEAVQEVIAATGESVPEYVDRAVTTQAKRDAVSIRMGINPATNMKASREKQEGEQ